MVVERIFFKFNQNFAGTKSPYMSYAAHYSWVLFDDMFCLRTRNIFIGVCLSTGEGKWCGPWKGGGQSLGSNVSPRNQKSGRYAS